MLDRSDRGTGVCVVLACARYVETLQDRSVPVKVNYVCLDLSQWCDLAARFYCFYSSEWSTFNDVNEHLSLFCGHYEY